MSPKFLGLENFSLSSVSASAAAYNTVSQHTHTTQYSSTNKNIFKNSHNAHFF